MAAFGYFTPLKEALAEGVHNFSAATFQVYLSNGTPSSTMSVKTNLAEISAGGGYTAGGNSCTVTASSLTTAGNYILKLTNPAQWVAGAGATIGPFRYAVLYNDTATNDPLIGYWDYGSAISLNPTETFDVTFDATNGVLQIT